MENFAAFMGIVAAFVVFLIGVAFAVPFGVKKLRESKVDPERALADRLARGEISEAEYARLFATLRFGPSIEDEDFRLPSRPASSEE